MYFILYNCIKVVKGPVNSIIIDTQNHKYFVINQSFLKALSFIRENTIESVFSLYKLSEKKEISKFIQKLEDEDIGFFAEEKENFSITNFADDSLFSHGKIHNAVIEAKVYFLPKLKLVLKELLDLGCRFLEVRFYNNLEKEELDAFFSPLNDSSVSSVSLYIPYSNWMEEVGEIQNFWRRYFRIYKAVIYDAPFPLRFESDVQHIKYIKQKITSLNCGTILEETFSCNEIFYKESQFKNTCLNKKVSIDKDGYIKNCPSMSESFGNIRDTTLAEAIEKPGFKKYWDITKDKVHVCKDCEFRYICTDCRAYVEDPVDILSKPLKCGYNPYTGEWSEWSTNPLKQKAIDFYGMREVVEKKD